VVAAENQSDVSPWRFAVRAGEKYVAGQVIDHHGFYVNQLRAAHRVFATGQSDVAPEEAVATVKAIALATESRERGGVWMDA
ncbi:MAG TPA: hypothetical protein VGE01_13615, partial [Fimbriimonas sp.]